MRPLISAWIAALLFGLALPSLADDLAPPPQGAIYIGNGRMLEAAQPRQLSLNAHVAQYTYQPGGLELAYAGLQFDGDKVTESIRLVGLTRGATLATLFSVAFHMGADRAPVEQNVPVLTSLAGWTADGRYLLIEQYLITTIPGQDIPHGETRYSCIDVGREPIRVTPVALPASPDTIPEYFWSPDRTSLLFANLTEMQQGDKHYLVDISAVIYDPATNRLKTLALPDKTFTRGWLDGSHILLESKTDTETHYFNDDLVKGNITEIAKPAKMPRMGEDFASPTPAVSPKLPLLELEDEAKTTTDNPKTATTPFHALWVRRTKGSKAQSAMPVGLTPGDANPQARWSPTGQQIAFVAHGDLFVTDLSERDATAREKLASGETLTCAEEQGIASSYLKQIGLGIIQYVQDNDEKYPEAAEMKDKVMPYLKDDSLFNVGGHPFVYHTPPGMTDASIDAPAETVLGTMDLPCAQIVLYADGHVKAMPKNTGAGTTPGGAGR